VADFALGLMPFRKVSEGRDKLGDSVFNIRALQLQVDHAMTSCADFESVVATNSLVFDQTSINSQLLDGLICWISYSENSSVLGNDQPRMARVL